MSSRQQFLLPNVTPGTRVRLDTASGSDSAADVVNNLNQAISGSIVTADSTGRLASGDIYGPAGVTTLYMKTLDGSGNVTGSPVTLGGAHPTSSGSDPRVDTILANAPTALDTLKEIADTLASDETAATALTTAVGLRGIDVSHGSTAGTARPTSSLPVTWHGTVAPTNAVARDLWYDEANDLVKRYNGSAWVTAGGTSTPDADATTKGKVQLAGDLGGTAASPTVPGLTAKAPLASPTFTGTPAAPTAAAGTSTTQLATTAFVAAAVVPTLQTKTANYTMTVADSAIVANGTSLTITAPSAVTAGATGKVYTIKNINATNLTLSATAGTFDGAASMTLIQYQSVSIVSDGANWFVI